MKIRSLIWSATLLLMLVAYMPVMAQDASEAAPIPQAQKPPADGSEAPVSLTSNVGGPVKRIYAITENTNKQRSEGGYLLVPGASISVVVPAGGTDLITATFSGECRLFGSPDKDDWLQVTIRDNGVPIEPLLDNGDPVAFCSDDNWASHSIQAVKRLQPGTHRIQVFWKLVDNGPTNNTLRGWLDDYSLVVVQSD